MPVLDLRMQPQPRPIHFVTGMMVCNGASVAVQATFVETVAKHAEAGVITGISDIRDESDRDGMRVVVELKRAIAPEVSRDALQKKSLLYGLYCIYSALKTASVPSTGGTTTTCTNTQSFSLGLRATWWPSSVASQFYWT